MAKIQVSSSRRKSAAKGASTGSLLRQQHLKILMYVELASKLGSIRKAAEQLNVASTAVNRSIIAMERSLETQLFERLPYGVRLTTAGELFIEHSRATIVDFERLLSEIDSLRGLRRGHVKASAIEAVASGLLPDMVADYQKSHPRVQFSVRIASTDQIIAALQNDEVDFAIAHNVPANNDVAVVAKVQQRLFAMVAHDHPLAAKDVLRLHECVQYPIALSDGGVGTMQMVERALAHNSLRVVPSLISNSFALMEAYCLRYQAVSFQIDVAANRLERSPNLRAIPLDEAALSANLELCVRKGRRLPVATASFIELAKHKFAALNKR